MSNILDFLDDSTEEEVTSSSQANPAPSNALDFLDEAEIEREEGTATTLPAPVTDGPITPVDMGSDPVLTDLEIPHTTMYEGLEEIPYLSDAEKQQIIANNQQRYKDSPESETDLMGRTVYKGNRLPEFAVVPNRILPGSEIEPVDIFSNPVVAGIEDGLKYMAIFGGDIADVARNATRYMTSKDSPLVSDDPASMLYSDKEYEKVSEDESYGNALDDYFSELQDTRLGSGLLKEASGMATGGGAAVAVPKILVSGAKWTSKTLKGIKNYLTKSKKVDSVTPPGTSGSVLGTSVKIAGGTTIATDPEASGIFLGREALVDLKDDIPLLANLDPDLEDEAYEQRLQNRINILLEGAVIGTAIEGSLKATMLGGKLLYSMGVANILRASGVGFRSEAETQFVKEVTARLYAVENAASGKSRELLLRELAQSIRDNEQIILAMDDKLLGDIQADQSTMNALFTAIGEGDLELAASTIAKARGIQQAQINKGGETARAATEVLSAADEGLRDASARLGGPDAVEDATTQLQREGIDAVDTARAASVESKAQLDEAVTNLDAALRSDPELAKAMEAVQRNTGIELGTGRAESLANMTDTLSSAYVLMKAQRKTLYDAVEGGTLDVELLVKELRDLEPEILDIAAATLPAGPLKNMMRLAAERPKTKMVDGKQVKKTAEELAEDELKVIAGLEKELAAVGATDFGTFFKNVRPDLARIKDELMQAGYAGSTASLGAGRTFDDFVRFIDDDLMEAADDEAVIAAVAAAKKFDAEEFAPVWRGEGPLAEIATSFDTNLAARSSEGPGVVKRSADNATFLQNVEDVLTVNLPRNQYGQQIVQTLKAQGGNAEDAYQYILSDVLSPLSTAAKVKGEYTDEMLISAIDRLQSYGPLITKEFPELADRIKVLQDDVLTKGGNVRRLQTLADEAAEQAARVEEEVFKGRLNEFFNAQGLPKDTGQQVWDLVFKNFRAGDVRLEAEDVSRFQKFADDILAQNDPVLVKGLQNAYLDSLRRTFFTRTKTDAGVPLMSLKTLDAEEDIGRWFEGLQIVFKEPDGTAPVADTIINLLSRAGSEQAQATRTAIAINSTTANKLEQQRALNSIITMVFGPLSRTGARIGAASRQFIGKKIDSQMYEDIADEMLADPKRFADAIDTILARDYPQGTTLGLMYETAITAFVKAGYITEEDELELKSVDGDLLESLYSTEAALNAEIEDARNSAGSIMQKITDQMRSLFQSD